MTDKIDIFVKLDGPEMGLDETEWPKFRDYLNAFIDLFGALDETLGRRMLPVSLSDGCLATCLRVPAPEPEIARRVESVVEEVRTGVKPQWSQAAQEKAENLYVMAEADGVTMSIGDTEARLQTVTVPVERRNWRIREHTTLLGEVLSAGGTKYKVTIRFEGDATIACKAGKERAKELGAFLYERVEVTGVAERSAIHGGLLAFEIEGARSLPERDFEGGVRRLRELMAESDPDYDPEEFIKRVRE